MVTIACVKEASHVKHVVIHLMHLQMKIKTKNKQTYIVDLGCALAVATKTS